MFVGFDERNGGLARRDGYAIPHNVFDKRAFLDAVLAKAGTKTAMAKALNLPTPRVMEMFSGARRVTLEEGMALAERFGVLPIPGVSAEHLAPVLRVCLRYAPKDGWQDADVQRLAQEIERGLELLQALGSAQGPDSPPAPDASDQPAPDKPH